MKKDLFTEEEEQKLEDLARKTLERTIQRFDDEIGEDESFIGKMGLLDILCAEVALCISEVSGGQMERDFLVTKLDELLSRNKA